MTRWGILNDAIGDWLNNDAPEETAVKKAENEHFVNFDDLQKRILSDMFADFRVLYPKRKAEIDIDFPTKQYLKRLMVKNMAYLLIFNIKLVIKIQLKI